MAKGKGKGKGKGKIQFKVDFKPFNAQLKATKNELKAIRGKVTKKDQMTISKQIGAIEMLLRPCNPNTTTHPPMSALYTKK